MSSLSRRICSIILLVFNPILLVPTLNLFSCNIFDISSDVIFSFPVISIFHMKLESIILVIIIRIKSKKKIFLFLYLCNINGIPFLLLIFTLHFVFFIIGFNFLKSRMPIFTLIIVEFIFFIFHRKILLLLQIFTKRSIKYPSISIVIYPKIQFSSILKYILFSSFILHL